MAWETRNGNRYYYRKRRIGDRVVSEYMGGDVGGLFAMLDENEQERRQLEREARRAEQEAQHAIDKQIDEVIGLARTLADAAMIEAGYHRHKGQWRRIRGSRDGETSEEGSADTG